MKNIDKPQNRLIHEKSPYLLQHAHNPVDWYPWGEEAFDRAKSEDKPIFLSIGYSTCHWCHVMAEESFADDEVGDTLNKDYISIKVDREERPDIDHIYMNYCQAMTGSGGWPMTIIMAADQKPFFAGTYFPKKSQRGMPGLIDILDEIAHLWKNDREKLYDIKDEAHRAIDPMFSMDGENESLTEDVIYEAFESLDSSYDSVYGGFGGAPKFPMPNYLMFLLRYHAYTEDERALEIVEGSLRGMYRGGMFDHIGGGFCRYSTDRRWLIPHFEKMLYDNALLAICYLECYSITKDGFYAYVARRIFEYIISDMTNPKGGFYTAEDADSEGVEGKFYVFTPEDRENILDPDEARDFCEFYNISDGGNFEGASIPNRLNCKDILEPDSYITRLRDKVFDAREKRIRPFRDEKILIGWNGLMIAALAMGARILGDDKLLNRAIEAVEFIIKSCRDENGRLYGSYIDGELSGSGYAHDYSYLIWGLIELYETSYNSTYLEYAIELTEDMLKMFYDREGGGLFLYGTDDEQLIHRPKDIYDGALPSSNSTATYNLLRLASLTGNRNFYNIGIKQLETFGATIGISPDGYTAFLSALMLDLFPSAEIVLVGRREDYALKMMIENIHEKFMPGVVSLVLFEGEDNGRLAEMSPFLKEYRAIDGKSAAYICRGHTCRPPITEIGGFVDEIQNL